MPANALVPVDALPHRHLTATVHPRVAPDCVASPVVPPAVVDEAQCACRRLDDQSCVGIRPRCDTRSGSGTRTPTGGDVGISISISIRCDCLLVRFSRPNHQKEGTPMGIVRKTPSGARCCRSSFVSPVSRRALAVSAALLLGMAQVAPSHAAILSFFGWGFSENETYKEVREWVSNTDAVLGVVGLIAPPADAANAVIRTTLMIADVIDPPSDSFSAIVSGRITLQFDPTLRVAAAGWCGEFGAGTDDGSDAAFGSGLPRGRVREEAATCADACRSVTSGEGAYSDSTNRTSASCGTPPVTLPLRRRAAGSPRRCSAHGRRAARR